MMKKELFVDPFQQPFFKNEDQKAPGARNLISSLSKTNADNLYIPG
jgi:hypothetical protein